MRSDPKKLSSKIVFFRSANSGETWSEKPLTISQPLTRNQAPWIVVDPNNPRIVYVVWRVFAAQAGGIANAIVGKKSTDGGATFGPSFPYPVALAAEGIRSAAGQSPGYAAHASEPTIQRLSDRRHRRHRGHPRGAAGIRQSDDWSAHSVRLHRR